MIDDSQIIKYVLDAYMEYIEDITNQSLVVDTGSTDNSIQDIQDYLNQRSESNKMSEFPTNALVKKAFLKLVYEYNSAPIQEIKEEFSNIHSKYMNSENIFQAYIISIQSHVEITKITELSEFREKYPEFLQLWGKYMKIQLEYSEYIRTHFAEAEDS